MAVPNWKVPSIIENSGAIIVGEESCIGERGTQNLTDMSGNNINDLIDAIVDRYFKIDCAIFTPNRSRIDHIKSMVSKYNAHGVIQYSLQFCTPYQMEKVAVEKTLENDNIPVLNIDTDYSNEDEGQLKTRVEAFIERVKD
jgi:benzoyl-CoA reductase/2-hydroxyglutaryl-CoA dehydratase subunit BcrC/BadD/HgdB